MLFDKGTGNNHSNNRHYDEGWSQTPFHILSGFEKPSNQVLQKNSDGTIEGVRYIIATEPSTLRPIKSWTIRIEKWVCQSHADISAEDILFMRIIKAHEAESFQYGHHIRHIELRGQRQKIRNENAFNAFMAAIVLISKIDTGRLPDANKILSIHNL